MKPFSVTLFVILLSLAFITPAWTGFDSGSYFSRNQGAYWKSNEFNYSYTPSTPSFEVKTDGYKSTDIYKGSGAFDERKKIMEGSPHKFTPSEFPPKMPRR